MKIDTNNAGQIDTDKMSDVEAAIVELINGIVEDTQLRDKIKGLGGSLFLWTHIPKPANSNWSQYHFNNPKDVESLIYVLNDLMGKFSDGKLGVAVFKKNDGS